MAVVSEAVRAAVVQQAGGICEYCRYPEEFKSLLRAIVKDYATACHSSRRILKDRHPSSVEPDSAQGDIHRLFLRQS